MVCLSCDGLPALSPILDWAIFGTKKGLLSDNPSSGNPGLNSPMWVSGLWLSLWGKRTRMKEGLGQPGGSG